MKKIIILGTIGIDNLSLFQKIIGRKQLGKRFFSDYSFLTNCIEEEVCIGKNFYKLTSTPDFDLVSKPELKKESRKQVDALVKESDLIIWLLNKDDELFLAKNYLRKLGKIVLFVVNKTGEKNLDRNSKFFSISDPGVFKLIQKIIETFPYENEEEKNKKKSGIKLLIFGPPNSGKSTLMNYLLKRDRSLVSSLSGTTQEPVKGDWSWKKVDFQLIDTAGITREIKINASVWRESDLVWVILDTLVPLTKNLLQIVSLAEKYRKPLFIIINKCDLVLDKEKLKEELKDRLKSLKHCPIIAISALKGMGMNNLIGALNKFLESSKKIFSKSDIEKAIEEMKNHPPLSNKSNKLKIYFAKHTKSGFTHQFILFVNNPTWLHFSHKRYISNYLRKHFLLDYVPIKVFFRKSV
jgi:GTP-binding protein